MESADDSEQAALKSALEELAVEIAVRTVLSSSLFWFCSVPFCSALFCVVLLLPPLFCVLVAWPQWLAGVVLPLLGVAEGSHRKRRLACLVRLCVCVVLVRQADKADGEPPAIVFFAERPDGPVSKVHTVPKYRYINTVQDRLLRRAVRRPRQQCASSAACNVMQCNVM